MRKVSQFPLCVFLFFSACLFEAPTASRFILNDSDVVEMLPDAIADDASKPLDLGSTEDMGERLDVGDSPDSGFSDGASDDTSRDTGVTDAVIHSDAEPIDGPIKDALVADIGILPDAESRDTDFDLDATPSDSGAHQDAIPSDTGIHLDATLTDIGDDQDAGFADSGARDIGMSPDSGATDIGQETDTGATDTSVDAGFPDAGPPDTGIPSGYVLIPSGSFMMGSPVGEPGRFPDEGPQHLVTITHSFFMKQTEIRRTEWRSILGTLPTPQAPCSVFPDDDCPVTALDRDLLIQYASRLSSREGLPQCYTGAPFNWTFTGFDCLGYRLPTEAEWEYAARAGTTTAYPFVPGSGQRLEDIAWYESNSQNSMSQMEIQPVATRQSNAWGLYDIIGNAIEVLHGRLTTDYSNALSVDPEESGAIPLSFWCTRGCTYTMPRSDCHSATRGGHPIGRAGTIIHGGRLVRTAP